MLKEAAFLTINIGILNGKEHYFLNKHIGILTYSAFIRYVISFIMCRLTINHLHSSIGFIRCIIQVSDNKIVSGVLVISFKCHTRYYGGQVMHDS